MRKIEQAIIRALRTGNYLSKGNTEVRFYKDSLTVKLHGNTVAEKEGNKLRLSWCGWYTPTTKSRLNCVLDVFAPEWSARIHKREGIFEREGRLVDVGELEIKL